LTTVDGRAMILLVRLGWMALVDRRLRVHLVGLRRVSRRRIRWIGGRH
jgi:hypothetical protein